MPAILIDKLGAEVVGDSKEFLYLCNIIAKRKGRKMLGFSVLFGQIIVASVVSNYGISVCEALPTYLTNLFNMHKIKPMRSYKVYGAGPHDGPLDYDAGVPRIAQPSEFQTPEEMIKHLTGRQYAKQASFLTTAGVNNNGNNNVGGETSRWSWLLPDFFRIASSSSPSPSSTSDRRRFKITSSVVAPDFPPSPYYASEYLSSTKNLAEVSGMLQEQSVVRTAGAHHDDVIDASSRVTTWSSREVANVIDNSLDLST